jgi:hypothetical protein
VAKDDKYYIAVCEVADKVGNVTQVERLGNAWQLTLGLATPAFGKLVKMRECSKKEWFSG